ncbi:MAG: AraC family transcriptional regulator [Rhodothermales bacterium]
MKQGFVRVGPLMGLPALVRELGFDPDPLFASSGFNPSQFSDPDTEVSFVSAGKLLARCVTETGCVHLGLLLGERVHPSSLGIAGFMLQAASDVGSALRDLVQYLDLHDRGAVVSLDTSDQNAILLGYNISLSGVEALDQINDLAMVVACNIMRNLCGTKWNPTEVLLSRPPPKELTSYRRVFRAPIRFDMGQSAIVFPERWMDYSITSADSLLHHHLEKEATELHPHRQVILAVELRRLLRKALVTRNIGAADIAKQLQMHERTLNRRLSEGGTSYRQELEKVRYEIARQLLTDNEMPLTQIAAALNYSDSTAFSRAFKGWSGNTPSEWRTRHRLL